MALPAGTFTLGRWHPMPPLWLEWRAWVEYLQLIRDPIFAGEGVADGGGRPVILIPGFMAGDNSLEMMGGWLKRCGYRPLRSGIAFNVQSSTWLIDQVAERIRSKVPDGRKVVVIGQSRGGILGVGLAQTYPELVERVISLGGPIGDPVDVHPLTMLGVHVARIRHALRFGIEDVDADFDQRLRGPVGVPVTSIYSKSDGIVHWEACLRPGVEDVEVVSSHTGMSVNPRVYREVARVLGRPA